MKQLILASKSKRRRELLEPYFSNLIIEPARCEETIDIYGRPHIEVMSAALRKAADIASQFQEGIVLGCDTMVFLEYLIGKPKDLEDARKIIKMLSGKTHQVFSGIAFIDCETRRRVVDYESTYVTFRKISDEEVEEYLRKADVMDKAGAYAIQEEAKAFLSEVRGDVNNVIGLPLDKVLNYLKSYGIEGTNEKNTTI